MQPCLDIGRLAIAGYRLALTPLPASSLASSPVRLGIQRQILSYQTPP
jgi:hypothetical protein